MYTKAIYVMVDFLAVIIMFFTLYALDNVKHEYAKWLKRALMMGLSKSFIIFYLRKISILKSL